MPDRQNARFPGRNVDLDAKHRCNATANCGVRRQRLDDLLDANVLGVKESLRAVGDRDRSSRTAMWGASYRRRANEPPAILTR